MDKYLLQILHEINTIIIPDLGALTITNSATGEIMFMSYLKYDDGKLWKHIAEKEGMEENDAKNLIAKYVREIKLKLDQGETYDMYQFGRFFKNNDGDVDFLNWSEIKAGSTNEINEAQQIEGNEEHPEINDEIIISDVEEAISETDSQEEVHVESKDENQEVESLGQNEETKIDLELQPQVTPAPVNDLDLMLKAAESEVVKEKNIDSSQVETETPVEETVPNSTESKIEVDKEIESVSSSVDIEKKEEPIEEVLKEKLEKSKTENIYLTPEEVSTIETMKIEVPVQEEKEEPKAQVKKKKGAGYWLLMIAGMLVIFGGTFAFVFYEEWSGKPTKDTTEKSQSKEPEEYLDEIISEENSEVSDETTLEERSDVPTPEFNDAGKKTEKVAPVDPVQTKTNSVQSQSKTNTTTQNTSVSNGNFHVIVGSFGVEENARKLANKLSAEGKNASVIGPKNGMYLVSAGSFSTQAEAASEVSSIGNAWILKK